MTPLCTSCCVPSPLVINIALSSFSKIESVLNVDLSGMRWFVHHQSITLSIDPFEIAVSANPEKRP